MDTPKVNGSESSVVQYYPQHRDQFTMFGEIGHFPGALSVRGQGVYWAGKTLKEKGIDYNKFVEGQLKYRRLNNNADY